MLVSRDFILPAQTSYW